MRSSSRIHVRASGRAPIVALALTFTAVPTAEAAPPPRIDVCQGGKLINIPEQAFLHQQQHNGATLPSAWHPDLDGDGFGDASTTTNACSQPAGYVADAADCDDSNAAVSPAASEICNAVDDDCDGIMDADTPAEDLQTWFLDGDGDGFGDGGYSTLACSQPAGHVADDTDCDDANADVNPNAAETCSASDDDCDGLINEGDAIDAGTWYADADGDLAGDPTTWIEACEVPVGWVGDASDCDDLDPGVFPGAIEVCDGLDDDCDGAADDADPDLSGAPTWFPDVDGDGYGDAFYPEAACEAPAGSVADDTDCDDADPGTSPSAAETCNGEDDDCDGAIDEPSAVDATAWYADNDADGYGDAATVAFACTRPAGFVANLGDCDDTSAARAPGRPEVCDDGIDQDCSGADLVCEVCDAFGEGADTWDFTASGLYFGTGFASPGDYDRDGYDDLAVSASAYEGHIHVWYGSPAGVGGAPDWSIAGSRSGVNLGDNNALDSVDVNHDGYDDLVVGAPSQSHVTGGDAYLYLGSPGGLAATPSWHVAGYDEYGYPVGLGDVNGDLYEDFAVAGPKQSGHVDVFYGGPTGPSTTPAWTVAGTGFNQGLGSGLASGDFNCDGYGDLAMYGGPETRVYYGSPTGFGATASWTTSGQPTSKQSGDYDHDGCADLAMSYPPRVFRGGHSGLETSPVWSRPTASHTVRSAGDLDGDHFDDLVTNQGASGQALVYFGGPSGPAPIAGFQFLSGGSSTDHGAGVGDLDGDGTGDLAIGDYAMGRFWVFYGSDGTCD